MTIEEENDAIRRVLSGSTDAFGPIVEAYQRNVYNLALRMTDSPEDALDMSQEAFIKAYNSLPSFRGDSKFSVWLYRIVSNVCLDFLRTRNRRAGPLSCRLSSETGTRWLHRTAVGPCRADGVPPSAHPPSRYRPEATQCLRRA